MVSARSTELRYLAAWLWSIALAFVALDRFLYFPVGHYNLRVCYIIFALSAFTAFYAEKKAYGSRVALYRLHDFILGGPWKYLLFYFLWVNIFAPFTDEPAHSVVYALVGWFSLVAVSISAQFIFSESKLGRVHLVPSRLKIPFYAYGISIVIYGFSFLMNYFAPTLLITPFFEDNLQLVLFFVMGYPLLFWDFINPKRHILPRVLSGTAMLVALATVFLIGHRALLAAMLLGAITLIVWGILKRIRFRRAVFTLVVLSLISMNAAFLLRENTAVQSAREKIVSILQARERQITHRIESWERTIEVAKSTNFLGTGIGQSSIKNGVWNQILAEEGLVGLLLYICFFGSLLRRLVLIRFSRQLVVSNAALVSVLAFIFIGSHYVMNPYGAAIWIWYAIWGLVALTPSKQEVVET